MSKSIDDFVAEIDKVFPGHGILKTHERMNSRSVSAENALAAFVVATVYDLYDETSPEASNVKRLATALELASYELAKLEEQLQQTSRTLGYGRHY
jgi:hypothetical protein